jgi:hypothetical protein
MKGMPTEWMIAVALALTGCYQAHGRPAGADGRVSDGGTGIFDDGAPEAGVMDGGLDLRACGLPITPECVCWIEHVTEDPNGRCITPYGDHDLAQCDVGNGCARDWLCNDLGNGIVHGRSRYGICVPREACTWLRSIDSRAVCFYEDGTPFDTGSMASEACAAEDRGIVCGPGCGGCASDQSCVGVSERSGLGLCVNGSPPTSSSRCGSEFPGCFPGRACVGFVLPSDVTTVLPEQVWHACVRSDSCLRLATHYPDRFRCLE